MEFLRHSFCLSKQAAASAILALCCFVVHAQPLSAPDYEVKAAFVYNFAKLTEWPTNVFQTDKSPIEIGIIGDDDDLATFLTKATKGRSIDNRKLSISRFKSIQTVTNCQVLFIATSERSNLHKILAITGNQPILTISEIDQFTELGGMIRLVKSDGGFHFELSKAAADRSALKLSSKLLSLAKSKPASKEERP